MRRFGKLFIEVLEAMVYTTVIKQATIFET
jgi:hypothetical protein